MLRLLHFIADLEDGVCPTADILIYPRRDTKMRDPGVFNFLAEKFYHVHRSRSRRPMQGWPSGPNAVAMDAFREVHTWWKEGRFEYEAAMLVESDCLPLRKGWSGEILAEWRAQDGLVLGHWDGSGKTIRAPISHMNGNLVFHPRLFDLEPDIAYGNVPAAGWDMAFWPKIAKYATPSKLIYNDYRLNTPKNPLRSCDHIWAPRFHRYKDNPLVDVELYPAYLHGIKGDEGIECARRKLLKEGC